MCYHIDKPQLHYARWQKSDVKPILYDFTVSHIYNRRRRKCISYSLGLCGLELEQDIRIKVNLAYLKHL